MVISSGRPGSGRELSCRGKQQSLANQVQSNPRYSCPLSYIYHVFCSSQGFHSYEVEYDTLILKLLSLQVCYAMSERKILVAGSLGR
jgi:hypothetical protein